MRAPLPAWGGGPSVSVFVLLVLLSSVYLTEQKVVNDDRHDGNNIQKRNVHDKNQPRLTHATKTPKTLVTEDDLLFVILGITALFIVFNLAQGVAVILSIPIVLFIWFKRRPQEPHTKGDIELRSISHQQMGVVPETAAQMDAVISELLNVITSPHLKETVRESFIPPSQLELGTEIGRGNFGRVLTGKMQSPGNDEPMKVAIKTLHARGRKLPRKKVESFLEEGVIMRSFNHPHVLRLLGVSINEQSNVPLIILPFMPVGDLHQYISDPDKNFRVQQLLQFGQQVAEGMAYLSTYGFVHRDLAARNCMVDEHLQVKVADFGLSRDLYGKHYYRCKSDYPLPIRWMAPESIEKHLFTVKSDVWSFGVLLWELMTHGEIPYRGVIDATLFHHLTSGNRLRQPRPCPDDVFLLMLDCWRDYQDHRPIFADLVNRLELIINPPGGNDSDMAVHDPLSDNFYDNIMPSNEQQQQNLWGQ